MSPTAIWWFASVEIFQSATSSNSCAHWTKIILSIDERSSHLLHSVFRPFRQFSHETRLIFLVEQVPFLAQRIFNCLPGVNLSWGLALSVKYEIYKQFWTFRNDKELSSITKTALTRPSFKSLFEHIIKSHKLWSSFTIVVFSTFSITNFSLTSQLSVENRALVFLSQLCSKAGDK